MLNVLSICDNWAGRSLSLRQSDDERDENCRQQRECGHDPRQLVGIVQRKPQTDPLLDKDRRIVGVVVEHATAAPAFVRRAVACSAASSRVFAARVMLTNVRPRFALAALLLALLVLAMSLGRGAAAA